MADILLIEDEAAQRNALEEYLGSLSLNGDRHRVRAAENLAVARELLAEPPDLIVSDLMLPDGTGVEFLKEAREAGVEAPCLILTAQPTIESAVEAIRSGANDYLQKPIELTLLKNRVHGLLELSQLKSENRELRRRLDVEFGEKSIIGHSPALRQVLEKVGQIAPTEVTVLLEGESGTGKEMFANLIHENSRRQAKPFIKVNCGALTKSILESELFGAVKGAYTGSDRDREGYFESADGGTIFLDEIGEMDMESQVRLLRVLEEREVVRVGSTKPIPVDVRIVAATNKNLLEAVDAGQFREDLYYRLAVIKLTLPALRERREDLPLLFNHFVTQFNEQYNKSVTRMTPDLTKFFQNYDWPGNIRQFRNIIEGMVVLAGEDTLDRPDLPTEIQNPTTRSSVDRKLEDTILPAISMQDYERAIIAKNLGHTGGNREKAASLLGISPRTLYRKIKEFDL